MSDHDVFWYKFWGDLFYQELYSEEVLLSILNL